MSVDMCKNDFTPPTISITSPTENESVAGSVLVTADVTDPSGIDYVEFYIGSGAPVIDTAAPFETLMDTTQMPNGLNVISVAAYDAAGEPCNVANNLGSAMRTFVV